MQGGYCWSQGSWCSVYSIWWTHTCPGSWSSQVTSIYWCICSTYTFFWRSPCSCWDLLCWYSRWGIQDPHIFEWCRRLWIWFSPWNQDSWSDQGWFSQWKMDLCWSRWWKEHLGKWSWGFSQYIRGSCRHCGQRYLLNIHYIGISKSLWSNRCHLMHLIFKLYAERIVVSTSCSLLHTAVDLVNETKLDDEIKSWLAFAAQKVVEVNALANALAGNKDEVMPISFISSHIWQRI